MQTIPGFGTLPTISYTLPVGVPDVFWGGLIPHLQNSPTMAAVRANLATIQAADAEIRINIVEKPGIRNAGGRFFDPYDTNGRLVQVNGTIILHIDIVIPPGYFNNRTEAFRAIIGALAHEIDHAKGFIDWFSVDPDGAGPLLPGKLDPNRPKSYKHPWVNTPVLKPDGTSNLPTTATIRAQTSYAAGIDAGFANNTPIYDSTFGREVTPNELKAFYAGSPNADALAFEDYAELVAIQAQRAIAANAKNGIFTEMAVVEEVAILEQAFENGTMVPRWRSTFSTLGDAAGSALGKALANGNELKGILYSSILGEVGERLFDAIANQPGGKVSVTEAVEDVLESQPSVGTQLWSRMEGAAIGTVSTYLAAELGEALGLEGFGAELVGAGVGSVLNKIISNVLASPTTDVLFGFDWKNLGDGFGSELWEAGGAGSLAISAVGSFLGSKLASIVATPQTQAGSILSSVGSAAGLWAVSTSGLGLGTGLSSAAIWGNFLLPGIGAFVGAVLGTLFGDLFGSKPPPPPTASAETLLQKPSAHYVVGSATAANFGNYDLAYSMASSAAQALNGMIALALGDDRTGFVTNTTSSVDQKYGHRVNSATQLNQVYVEVNNVRHFKDSADEAVEYGVLSAIKGTQILGGDIFVKRAISRSQAKDLLSFSGDLVTAQEYSFYSHHTEFVNGLISDAFGLSDIEEALYSNNKAVIDKLQSEGVSALSTSELNFYNSNRLAVDRIVSAIENQTVALPWIITLQRAAELGLDQWNPASDWIGATKGFLDHFDLQDYDLGYEHISLDLTGTSLKFSAPPTGPDGVFSVLPQASADGRELTIANFGSTFGYGNATSSTIGNSIGDYSTSGSGIWADEWHTNQVGSTVYYSSSGDDIYVGSNHTDVIHGATGRDWIDGGSGNDFLFAGDDARFNYFMGLYGQGNGITYSIPGTYEPNVVLGGAGTDLVVGGWGDDYLSGGDGDDWYTQVDANGNPVGYIVFNPLTNQPMAIAPANAGVWGGWGNDTLVGGLGKDHLMGEDGDDTFIVDPVDNDWDLVNGGNGSDTLSYERFTGGITLDMSVKTNLLGMMVISAYYDFAYQVENVTGSDFDDVITGDSLYNVLKGGAGDDVLNGANDLLEGGQGADQLNAGAGSEISYKGSLSGVSIDLSTGEAFGGDADGDSWTGTVTGVTGSLFGDQLKGNAGSNVLRGLDGDDWFVGSEGADEFQGGEGFDFADFSGSASGLTARLVTQELYDYYYGYGWYTLPAFASDGANYTYLTSIEGIVGSDFADTLEGGEGNQSFVGGAGNDSLSGGTESDTYYFGLGDGFDTINETHDGSNVVVFGPGIKVSDFSFAQVTASPIWQIRGTNDKISIPGNTSNFNNKIKAISFNGASKLDIGKYEFIYAGTDAANTLIGDAGDNDFLLGYNGNDTIFTHLWTSSSDSTYKDTIIGGLGDDLIKAGSGDNQFAYDRGDGVDTIVDKGGLDTLVFGSTVAAEDVIYEIDSDGHLYIGLRDESNPSLTASQVTSRIKVQYGGVKRTSDGMTNTIEMIQAGGITIDLLKADLNWKMVSSFGGNWWTPIVLDLEGDGLDLSAAESSLIVAKTAGGTETKIGWAGPTDGYLAVDRNKDGKITQLSEISFTQDKEGATSDLEGLKTWDSNDDNVLDAKDARWGELRLFVDKNQNGRSSPNELSTLEAAGITSIDLKGASTGLDFTTGGIDNFVQNTLKFTRADGTEGQAYDVALARYLIHASGPVFDTSKEFSDLNDDAELGRALNEAVDVAVGAKKVAALVGEGAARDLFHAAKGTGVAGQSARNTIAALVDNPSGPSIDKLRETITYEEVKEFLSLEFSDEDVAISDLAQQRWNHKLDPAVRAALEADKADGLIGNHDLAALNAVSSDRAARDAAGISDPKDPTGIAPQLDPAVANERAQPFDPFKAGPRLHPATAATLKEEFDQTQADLRKPLGEPPPIESLPRADVPSDWWRFDTDGGSRELPPGFTPLSQVLADGAPKIAGDGFSVSAEAARQQQALRQGLAAFTADKGAAPAIWQRAGEQGVEPTLSPNPTVSPTSIRTDSMAA